MSSDISDSLLSLKKQVKSNAIWVATFTLIALLLASALIFFSWLGLDMLNEQIGLSPQYQLEQSNKQLKSMEKAAEVQYSQFHQSNLPNPLDIIKEKIKLENGTLTNEELDWELAVDLYRKIINRHTNHLGNIKEWQYFHDQKLASLIAQSTDRQERIPVIKDNISLPKNQQEQPPGPNNHLAY